MSGTIEIVQPIRFLRIRPTRTDYKMQDLITSVSCSSSPFIFIVEYSAYVLQYTTPFNHSSCSVPLSPQPNENPPKVKCEQNPPKSDRFSPFRPAGNKKQSDSQRASGPRPTSQSLILLFLFLFHSSPLHAQFRGSFFRFSLYPPFRP